MSRLTFGAALAAFALLLPAARAAEFRDVLDTPAVTSALAPMGLLNGVARAGQRIVAVGQRGHIVYSDDAGRNWVQAKVPVSSDLVAVSFPTPSKGWAVGHDGVVLHSADSGATWTRQLDGRSAGQAMVAYYTAEAGKGALGTPEQAAKWVAEAKRFAEQGAENPFLDVWFENEQTGFVVGAFNLILRTDDGGKTWEPWFHRSENPKVLHLYAIRPAGGELYIAGEQGLLLKLDAPARQFRAVQVPYQGTLFGITGSANSAVVFGLRGNTFRSTDGGRIWQKVETGLQVGLTGGAAVDGRIVLVSQAGHVLVSSDDGASFKPLKTERPLPAAAVVGADKDAVVIAGPRGVRAQPLN
ncbi:MAG TPA: YCF48-related protein [Burkholderiales bacterium]